MLGIAFIAQSQTSLEKKNIQLRSNFKYGNQILSNVWGYTQQGKEYALVGAQNGLSFVAGPSSAWREIRTIGHYAFVTTEGFDTKYPGGLVIVDLSGLPNSINHVNYTANNLRTIHALHVDTAKKKLYLYGSNLNGGGSIILDVQNPMSPTVLGNFTQNYHHDGYVENDTMYAGAIYNGELQIIDARDPQNLVMISQTLTPKAFTHNTWRSTDRKIIYTTDERKGSSITAYDITDPSSPKELDQYNTKNNNAIVHNTYVLRDTNITKHDIDYLVQSYYVEGVTIVDASKPDNMVEVGNYDTSPFTASSSGGGFNGAWGVYPYLPSGNLLISDIEEGLFVLTPTYTRASYVEGLVRDTVNHLNLSDVKITFANNKFLKNSKADGTFKTGWADSGYFSLKFSKPGYKTLTVDSVHFEKGKTTQLLVGMTPDGTSIVENTSIPAFKVYPNPSSGLISIESPFTGEYTIEAFDVLGKRILNQQSNTSTPNLELPKGLYLLKLSQGNQYYTNQVVIK
jgi:choice-of-anchor B domain-containing protein